MLVRVHSQCLTGDVFGSSRCDCGEQLELAMEKIVEAGKGVFLYLLQEGRGIGLVNKLKAYELQDEGHDTVSANEKLGFPPDIRNYGVGCQILRDLGVRKMRLMTNNPSKYVAIDGYGLEIVERVPLEVAPHRPVPQVPRSQEEQDGAPAEARLSVRRFAARPTGGGSMAARPSRSFRLRAGGSRFVRNAIIALIVFVAGHHRRPDQGGARGPRRRQGPLRPRLARTC